MDFERFCQDDGEECADTDKKTTRGHAVHRNAAIEAAGRPCKAGDGSAGPETRQERGLADAHAENFAAIGFEQDVLHRKGCGPERDGDEKPDGSRNAAIFVQGLAQADRFAARCGQLRIARLLLPHRHDVENDRQKRGPLDHLDERLRREVDQKDAVEAGRRHHADQQHDIEQRHHPGPLGFRHDVGGERQTGGLGHVKAEAREKEGKAGACGAGPARADRLGLKKQEREGHDRQTAELQQASEPEIRHAAPAEHGLVGVRPVAEEEPQGGGENRKRHHGRNQRDVHAEFDDQHAIERAGQQDHDAAGGNLEQRQPQKTRQRHVLACRIRKRHEARAGILPERDHLPVGGRERHQRDTSTAWDL